MQERVTVPINFLFFAIGDSMQGDIKVSMPHVRVLGHDSESFLTLTNAAALGKLSAAAVTATSGVMALDLTRYNVNLSPGDTFALAAGVRPQWLEKEAIIKNTCEFFAHTGEFVLRRTLFLASGEFLDLAPRFGYCLEVGSRHDKGQKAVVRQLLDGKNPDLLAMIEHEVCRLCRL